MPPMMWKAKIVCLQTKVPLTVMCHICLNIKFVHYPPNCTSVIPSRRTGYGEILRSMSASVLMHLQIMSPPQVIFPPYESYDDHEAGSSIGGKAGGEHDHELVTSFANTHTANKTVKSSCYTHSTG